VLSSGTLGVARGGTNLSSSPDDAVMVGNGTTWELKALPAAPCTNSQKLAYVNSTNLWECQGGITAAGVPALSSLPTLPDAAYPAGAIVYLTTDQKLYRSTGSAWTKATDGADIVTDSITAGQINAAAVGTSELASNAVTAEKISASQITVSQLVENYGDNLFPNGTSEVAPPCTGCAAESTSEFVYRSTSAAAAGTYGRRITNLETLSAEAGAYPGEKFSFQLSARKTGGTVNLRIDFYVSGTWQLMGTPVQIFSDSGTFSSYEVKATAPSNTTRVRFAAYAWNGNTTADFDNLYARRQVDSKDLADASLLAQHFTDSSISWHDLDHRQTGTIVPDEIGYSNNTLTWTMIWQAEMIDAAAGVGHIVTGWLNTDSVNAGNGIQIRVRLSSATNHNGSCTLKSYDGTTWTENYYTLSATGQGVSYLASNSAIATLWKWECAVRSTAAGTAYLIFEGKSENSGSYIYVRKGSYFTHVEFE
jgi:hypothetical protein